MRLFVLLFAFLTFSLSYGQEDQPTDYSRLPDKSYLHLDKNLYSQGDTIWAKAYVFHRNNNNLSDNSYSLHIQVLSESGAQVGTYKMLVVGGMGYGQIPIYESMKPGFYQIIAHTGHMKNFGQQFFHKQTIEVSNNEGEVSLKCFFNRENYSVGDTAKVMINAYDEFQMAIPKKRFSYRLTHNDKVIKKGTTRCDENGSANIWLPVTAGTKENPFKLDLRWYVEDVDFSQNEMKETVYLPMHADELQVDFFPEGGDMINGMSGRVAFKATNKVGKPVDIEGVLLEDGEEILQVSSMHRGMGYFSFVPNGKEYSFRVTKPEVREVDFALPQMKDAGYGFTYLRQNAEEVMLSVLHNYDEKQDISLWISQNDQLLAAYDLSVSQQRVFNLSKDLLPEGLVTFTITDANNVPQAERLIYVNKEQKPLDITLNEIIFSERKKVNVKIKADANTHLSVSVVDSVLGNSPWLSTSSIKAYTMLETELNGKLDNMDYYLGSSSRVEIHRNLLLMTHGWRRYNWISNQVQLDSIQLYNFNCVDGQVKKRSKSQGKASLTAMVLGEAMSFSEFEADDDGRFRLIPEYEDYQSQRIILMAKNAKGNDNVRITINNLDTVTFSSVTDANKDNLAPLVLDKNRYYSADDVIADDELPFLSYETKMLQELVVYGRHYDPEEEEAIDESVKAFSAGSVSGEDLSGGYSFASFVSQASFRAQYNHSTGTIIVRARGGATTGSSMGSVELDDEGNVVTEDAGFGDVGAEIYVNDMRWGKDANSLDFLTKEDIAEIVVLDPQDAFASYGSEGEQGIILVRTRSQDITDRQHSMNSNMAVFGKFIDAKEFFNPVYETKAQDSLVVVDNRTTLHWSPFVTTDENGEAEIEFYTDDISGVKQVVVQGVDETGHLYYETKSFDVNVIGF